MSDSTTRYGEALAAQIHALEVAQKALQQNSPEAIDSIYRLAHSLCDSSRTYGFPEISEVAHALQKTIEELPTRLQDLLATLREATANGQGEAEPVGILIIEDSPETTHLLQRKLYASHREILVAKTAADAERILEEKEISLILLDLSLADMDGRRLLVRLRERNRTAEIPIFVLSSRSGALAKTECFALGADEYFEKPFNPETLFAAVAAKLHRVKTTARESRQDSLTGLPNRAAFVEAFGRAQALATRANEPLSLAMIDFDGFKMINDTYGHAVGDEVLRRAALVMSKPLRRSDYLARWGGEEFVALFPKTDQPGAVRALGKALETIREELFQAPDGRTFKVSFSAGIAKVKEGVSVEDAVAEADRFLYRAKVMGKDRVLSEESAGSKILLLESDELIAGTIEQRLKDEGFEIQSFREGTAALTAAMGASFSLIIVDAKAPGTDGLELVKRLRQMALFAEVPVMVITSIGTEEEVKQISQLGADDYIVRPFSMIELVARIQRLLNRKRSHRPSRQTGTVG
ncbi:MAG TPA: diguanylate cyclase [Acidobacteriota bacterium]|nr:diguanylate cyclase [Acidobacteriota bacterium]